MTDESIVPCLQSKELSNVHLRRGERKVLNAINQRKHNNEVRFHVAEPGRPDKPRVRITSGAEKIVILVRSPAHSSQHTGAVLRLPCEDAAARTQYSLHCTLAVQTQECMVLPLGAR